MPSLLPKEEGRSGWRELASSKPSSAGCNRHVALAQRSHNGRRSGRENVTLAIKEQKETKLGEVVFAMEISLESFSSKFCQ